MAWNLIRRIADAVRNDVNSGLRGYHTNMSMSIELLELDVVDTRLLVIKEYMAQGILPILDLVVSMNCIPVDCERLTKCGCNASVCGKPVAHFLIPQILFDYGLNKAIQYIGSSDKLHPFLVYTQPINQISTFLKYRKRGKKKPWVYIDVTPNSEGLLDCYIFGIPLIKQVSVIAILKDPRLLEEFSCQCEGEESLRDSNYNFIDTVVKDRLTLLKIKYYRSYLAPILPNNQQYSAG